MLAGTNASVWDSRSIFFNESFWHPRATCVVISRVVILLIAATKVSTVVAVVTLALDALNGVAF
jgi:hypothetical protein